jgi:hypothetical protein
LGYRETNNFFFKGEYLSSETQSVIVDDTELAQVSDLCLFEKFGGKEWKTKCQKGIVKVMKPKNCNSNTY